MEGTKRAQHIIDKLNANWTWIADWTDCSNENTAGRIVTFRRSVSLQSACTGATIHCTADTRYKLYINGERVAIGPVRSSTAIWYYDTLDISRYLRDGENEVVFRVLRYFARSRAAMPFERTAFPGLTVVGTVHTADNVVDLSTCAGGWQAYRNPSIRFPTGLVDDVFLHISERVHPIEPQQPVLLVPYRMRTLNGDLLPWYLEPRGIPLPELTPASFVAIHNKESSISSDSWLDCSNSRGSIQLEGGSSHVLELLSHEHSTAFIHWQFRAKHASTVTMKVTYSEGYEKEPRDYPFFRAKADRLDARFGYLIGPFDSIELKLTADESIRYEPFWFRTYRIIRLEINVGANAVELERFVATQVNYPLNCRASWIDASDSQSKDIWDVSVRTMRNCMFDGYSDCPFYEQLQYSCDSRSVALFHYLLSGDDQLMRQAITNFAASFTHYGLPQSRFPSHVRQHIAGFALFWILAIRDHYLYFDDRQFTRTLLPHIDRILAWFESYVNPSGLVANFPDYVWQYVDWVTTWGATESHPDKGVPTSGRQNSLHTFFSLLYAYVLQQASSLLTSLGREGAANEYSVRATAVIAAIRKHCYGGRYFTDSTADIAGSDAYSQHCQVFAVLCGAAEPSDSARLLRDAFHATPDDGETDEGNGLGDQRPNFARCSYMMRFYAFRAFAVAGDRLYESFWPMMMASYRKMLADNLSTWEEDDVRQRSDCHAWGSVPIYEFCTEIAGVKPVSPGWQKVLFEPRLRLSQGFKAKIALGRSNTAFVEYTVTNGVGVVSLEFERPIATASRLPGGELIEQGIVRSLQLTYAADQLHQLV